MFESSEMKANTILDISINSYSIKARKNALCMSLGKLLAMYIYEFMVRRLMNRHVLEEVRRSGHKGQLMSSDVAVTSQ